MDVLYRVRPGDSNEPLRYSLRSLANVEHGQVYVVGYCPVWLTGVEWIKGSELRGKWKIVLDHLAIATRELGDRTVLLIDDDMIVRQPWVPEILHAPGVLLDHAWEKRGSYQRSLWWTDQWLRSRGIRAPLSYELHVPLPIECSVAAPLLAEAMAALSGNRSHLPLQGRSIYGNLAAIGGREAQDVKLHSGEPEPDGALLSLDDSTERQWLRRLAQMFPDPSAFER